MIKDNYLLKNEIKEEKIVVKCIICNEKGHFFKKC